MHHLLTYVFVREVWGNKWTINNVKLCSIKLYSISINHTYIQTNVWTDWWILRYIYKIYIDKNEYDYDI